LSQQVLPDSLRSLLRQFLIEVSAAFGIGMTFDHEREHLQAIVDQSVSESIERDTSIGGQLSGVIGKVHIKIHGQRRRSVRPASSRDPAKFSRQGARTLRVETTNDVFGPHFSGKYC
jgi:hypothetical protein